MKKVGIVLSLAAVLLIAPPGARADNIPPFLNPIWELIWTFFCWLPFFSGSCTTCESVSVSDGKMCQLRLIDNSTNPTLDVVLMAKNGPSSGLYEVVEDALSPSPKSIQVERTGSTVLIDPSGALEGEGSQSKESCAHILLSYDYNENEFFPTSGNPVVEEMEGSECSEFGATLVWYMIVNKLPYYKN